jgi:arginine deiminase
MLYVTSEVGRLRRVLVHEPGPEVDLMAPGMMEELLFDDILFGERAREEHRIFCRVLDRFGVEVAEARDLLEETLEVAEARAWLLTGALQDLPGDLRARVREAPPAEVAGLLQVGLRAGARAGRAGAGGLAGAVGTAGTAATTDDWSQAREATGRRIGEADPLDHGDALYELPPLPNWCFQRDPQVVIGSGVAFASMAARARHREAILARAIFRFHPELSGTPVLFDPLDTSHHGHLFTDPELPRIEGGDLLVLSADTLAVGLSERTNRSAVLHLAQALARREDGPRRLLVVAIPRQRAYMHLDTLITPVDRDAALIFPPVLAGDGPEAARTWEIDLRSSTPEPVVCDGLLPALARCGLDLQPIPCGGSDPLFQRREQWTDGANALAVAPGVILLYDRNVRTADELARHGFRVVSAEDLLSGREEVVLDEPGRTCVLIPSHELSRARGGPHCLSHPLEREEA